MRGGGGRGAGGGEHLFDEGFLVLIQPKGRGSHANAPGDLVAFVHRQRDAGDAFGSLAAVIGEVAGTHLVELQVEQLRRGQGVGGEALPRDLYQLIHLLVREGGEKGFANGGGVQGEGDTRDAGEPYGLGRVHAQQITYVGAIAKTHLTGLSAGIHHLAGTLV